MKEPELIDYFAGCALQGLLSGLKHPFNCNPADAASFAFQVAQAMLDERIEVPDEQ